MDSTVTERRELLTVCPSLISSPPTFHPFSRLPQDLRELIWHSAVSPGVPTVHYLDVHRLPSEILPAGTVMKSAGSCNLSRCCRATNTWVDKEKKALGVICGGHAKKGTTCENYGLLNACTESRRAVLWCVRYVLGDTHLALKTNPFSEDSFHCIAMDVARDAICLRLDGLMENRGRHASDYKVDLFRTLRVARSGQGVTRLAIEVHPFWITGEPSVRCEMDMYAGPKMFHPFLLESIAELRRETFSPEHYSEHYRITRNPFIDSYDFKGKFYLIDRSIRLANPSPGLPLESCIKPEFVYGHQKFYKVSHGNPFFNHQQTTRALLLLDRLRHEIARQFAIEERFVVCPFNLDPLLRLGCSMDLLACV